jgi:hypothetical protein
MLTALDENITVTDVSKKPDSVRTDNTYIKNGVNQHPKDIEKECRVKVESWISGWAAPTGVNVLVKDIECDTRFAKRNSTIY